LTPQQELPPPELEKPDRPVRRPYVTWFAVGACIVVYLGLAVEQNYESWDTLSRWGYLSAASIWRGALWGLLTSTVVHFALWHLAFNVFWLWVFGTRLEQTIGSWRFAALYVVAAFVSSGLELATSDSTGIGASGVVYALFGFLWVARLRDPTLANVLDNGRIKLFVIWLFGCMAATFLGIVNVGNVAHVAGLLLGVAVAGSFVTPQRPWLARAGLAALVVAAAVPLYWCPWSSTWVTERAYALHHSERYQEALSHYNLLIDRDPENAWAYANRSQIYEILGEHEKAASDLATARSLDSRYEEPP
jgi:rhomboid protease GluP